MSSVKLEFSPDLSTRAINAKLPNAVTLGQLTAFFHVKLGIPSSTKLTVISKEPGGYRIILDMDAPLFPHEVKKPTLFVQRSIVSCLISSTQMKATKIVINANNKISSIIEEFQPIESDLYSLVFQKDDQNIVCPSDSYLPLCDWTGENLFIVRRLIKNDPRPGTDCVELFKNYKLAASLNLSHYPVATWAKLAVLQFVVEGQRKLDAQYIKANLLRAVPSSLCERIMPYALEFLPKVSGLTQKVATENIITVSISEGTQLGYSIQAKVKLSKGKWVYSSRIVVVGFSKIYFTKGVDDDPEFSIMLDTIKDMHCDGESLFIRADGDKDIEIKSERVQTLHQIITEFKDTYIRTCSGQEIIIPTPQIITKVKKVAHKELKGSKDTKDQKEIKEQRTRRKSVRRVASRGTPLFAEIEYVLPSDACEEKSVRSPPNTAIDGMLYQLPKERVFFEPDPESEKQLRLIVLVLIVVVVGYVVSLM